GHEVILVSSAAISAGVAALGLSARPTDVLTLQALAAAGQPRLMEEYNRALGRHGIVAAQVLLVPHDFADRQQYLHSRDTLTRLIEIGCIPIVNENDTVANDEIRFGDNDRIAALVAHNVSADLLVLLTDTPGLYTADPRIDPSAALIVEVAANDPLLSVSAGAQGTARGSGGMASKLQAARIASWSGVRAVIAKATREHALVDAARGIPVGTSFAPNDRLSARKLWIGFASHSQGRVMVDNGAYRALVSAGSSLLPAGVVAVEGDFSEGATVEVCTADGTVFARGMTVLDAANTQQYMGRSTRDLPARIAHEVIHRDDLVVLPHD
ncbi:MAG TPA: glutamate 5-kinase, partial [Ilumatobacteraceae bacterium]|nr:glutamate 5-kinase [Ilumatobacteraceae bacterium]